MYRFAHIERAQGCRVGSRESNAHIELVQGGELMSLAELINRLQATIENFERAEILANHLARVIVCALAYLEPAEGISLEFDRIVEPAFPSCQHITTSQEPWPPPDRIPERQCAFENQ